MDDQPWDWERILDDADDSDLTDYGAADEKRRQGSPDNHRVSRRTRKNDSKGSGEAVAQDVQGHRTRKMQRAARARDSGSKKPKKGGR